MNGTDEPKNMWPVTWGVDGTFSLQLVYNSEKIEYHISLEY